MVNNMIRLCSPPASSPPSESAWSPVLFFFLLFFVSFGDFVLPMTAKGMDARSFRLWATLVSSLYVSDAFEEIGFSLEAFLSSPAAAAMNDDEKFLHLDQRLSYAITRRTINRIARAAMDMPDDLRQHAIQALELSYTAADRAGAILSKVDGQ